MKIGLIGAESKHVEYFSKPINIDNQFGNARIKCIWGGDTTEERLRAASYEAEIDEIMKNPDDVINQSDAVIITLRNGALHAQYAIECIKKRKPVFIDKPFTTKIEDAINIVTASSKYATPFTGGSTLCFLPEIPKLREINTNIYYTEISYRANPFSPFGGWNFYGSHLTDLCSAICGTDASYVEAKMLKHEVIVDVYYNDSRKKVRIYSAPDLMYPLVKMDKAYILSDETCYTNGLKAFFDMISTGKSHSGERLLYSVKLMDAIARSASTGKSAIITD